VRDAVIGLLDKDITSAVVADVGAGTGIWTRMLAERSPRMLTAIEPNDDMRTQGMKDTLRTSPSVQWQSGSGESTGLQDSSVDWITMASSFHWVDFELGLKEFRRVLRSGGWFTALWNPRIVESNPVLVSIEKHLLSLAPDLQRKSSGRSGLTKDLTSRLEASKSVTNVVYIESKHTIRMSIDRYLGAWRSVNDVRSQLGEAKFHSFLDFTSELLRDESYIDATYLTRAWSARFNK
jgi:ubiquinone/menaquinone biosynthesis C-methylase UbiE